MGMNVSAPQVRDYPNFEAFAEARDLFRDGMDPELEKLKQRMSNAGLRLAKANLERAAIEDELREIAIETKRLETRASASS